MEAAAGASLGAAVEPPGPLEQDGFAGYVPAGPDEVELRVWQQAAQPMWDGSGLRAPPAAAEAAGPEALPADAEHPGQPASAVVAVAHQVQAQSGELPGRSEDYELQPTGVLKVVTAASGRRSPDRAGKSVHPSQESREAEEYQELPVRPAQKVLARLREHGAAAARAVPALAELWRQVATPEPEAARLRVYLALAEESGLRDEPVPRDAEEPGSRHYQTRPVQTGAVLPAAASVASRGSAPRVQVVLFPVALQPVLRLLVVPFLQRRLSAMACLLPLVPGCAKRLVQAPSRHARGSARTGFVRRRRNLQRPQPCRLVRWHARLHPCCHPAGA